MTGIKPAYCSTRILSVLPQVWGSFQFSFGHAVCRSHFRCLTVLSILLVGFCQHGFNRSTMFNPFFHLSTGPMSPFISCHMIFSPHLGVAQEKNGRGSGVGLCFGSRFRGYHFLPPRSMSRTSGPRRRLRPRLRAHRAGAAAHQGGAALGGGAGWDRSVDFARRCWSWLWLKKPVPKWNPGKWKHGPKCA